LLLIPGSLKICLIAGLKSQDSFFLIRGVIWLFNNNNKVKSINIYLFILKYIIFIAIIPIFILGSVIYLGNDNFLFLFHFFIHNGCFLKFGVEVGVELSIVNRLYRLRITDQLFKSYAFTRVVRSQSTLQCLLRRQILKKHPLYIISFVPQHPLSTSGPCLSCTPHDVPCTYELKDDAPSIYGRLCRDIEQFL
jgi:hypothetical protein